MKSKSGAFTTIEVSNELSCDVIPLVLMPSQGFTSDEDRFFTEGEALSTEAAGLDDTIAAQMPRRWLGKRRSLMAGAVGLAVIAGTVLLIRSGGQAADRAQDVAPPGPERPSMEMPAPTPAASATAQSDKPAVVPHEPAAIPAPAPADDGHPTPEVLPPLPGQASAGARAGSTDGQAFEDCKRAFDQRRSRDVLAKCAAAFAEDPKSVDAAVMLAKTEFDRGRTAQALDWAKKAVALDVGRADAYVFLGGAEQAAGHNGAAKAAYKRYLQLAPQGRYAADLRAVIGSL